jgi:hypothetical protein
LNLYEISKKVAYLSLQKDFISILEKKYPSKITINLDLNTVSIEDCTTKAITFIENEIKKECKKKFVTCYQSDPFPGLSKLFGDQTFSQIFLGKLKNIQGIYLFMSLFIFLDK